MRIAFLGAGFVNFGTTEDPWDHASRLEKLPGVDVVAIVEPLKEKAEKILKTKKDCPNGAVYQNCRLFPTLQTLLSSDVKVGAAIVGTPPYTRGTFEDDKDLELKLAEAGIHTFCEKPLTSLEPEEFANYSKTVSDSAKKKGIVLSVGYMFRYHSAFRKMKDLIQSYGGKVMSFEARYYYSYSANRSHYWWDVNKSGGTIVEQATHFCDIARYLVGDVDESTIQTLCLRAEEHGGAGEISSPEFEKEYQPEQRLPRVTMSHWRFQSGGLGSLVHTIALQGGNYETSIDVQLDGLRLTLHEPYQPECTLRVRDREKATVYSFGDTDPYKEELQHFLKAIETNDPSLIQSTYQDATKTFNFTWAIRRAEEKQK